MVQRRVPLLHVQGGRIVEPDGSGGWKPKGGPEASVDVARNAYKPSESLYLVDLDGQFNGVANLEFLQSLERRQVFPWVDAGARKAEDVMDLLMAGAESITMQLRHMSPAQMEEVSGLSECDLYVGFTAEARGLEKGLRARDALELVARVGAVGVVIYEGPEADLHQAENVAFDIQRAGVPVVWVGLPGSTNARRAAESARFAVYVGPEAAA